MYSMDDTSWVVQRDISIRNIQLITLPPKHPLILPFPLDTILQYLLLESKIGTRGELVPINFSQKYLFISKLVRSIIPST